MTISFRHLWPSEGGAGRVAAKGMIAALAIAALASTLRVLQGAHIVDDAYITFRYSRNLASGLGLVYNSGESVLGTTTPLYAMLLALLHLALRAAYPTLALAVNATADAVTCLLLVTMLQSQTTDGLSSGRFRDFLGLGLLWAFGFAILAQSVAISVSGMETSFYTMLIMAAFWLFLRRRHMASGLLAGLAVLTRPDALVAAGLIGVFLLLYERRKMPRWGAGIAIVVLPWLVISWAYYGQLIPNSMIAKSSAYQPMPPGNTLLSFAAYFSNLFLEGYTSRLWDLPVIGQLVSAAPRRVLIYERGFPWVPVAGLFQVIFFIAGAVFITREERRASPVVVFPLAYIAAYSLANPLMFEWYFVPLLPYFLMTVLTGMWVLGRALIGALCRLLRMCLSEGRMRIAIWAILSLILVASQIRRYELIPDGRRPWLSLYPPVWLAREDLYRDVAMDLAGELTPDVRVAAPEIGALGYYSEARILDTAGLVSPEAIPYNPVDPSAAVTNYAISPRAMLELHPDYLISLDLFILRTLLISDEFQRAYRVHSVREAFIWGGHSLYVFVRND